MKTECLEAGKDENGGFISTAVLVLVTEGDKGKFEISEMKLRPHYCSLFFSNKFNENSGSSHKSE